MTSPGDHLDRAIADMRLAERRRVAEELRGMADAISIDPNADQAAATALTLAAGQVVIGLEGPILASRSRGMSMARACGLASAEVTT